MYLLVHCPNVGTMLEDAGCDNWAWEAGRRCPSGKVGGPPCALPGQDIEARCLCIRETLRRNLTKGKCCLALLVMQVWAVEKGAQVLDKRSTPHLVHTPTLSG